MKFACYQGEVFHLSSGSKDTGRVFTSSLANAMCTGLWTERLRVFQLGSTVLSNDNFC